MALPNPINGTVRGPVCGVVHKVLPDCFYQTVNLVHILQHQAPDDEPRAMNSRLLLVEPSTTMRFVLDNYLQSLGHTVVSMGDYQDAVEALRDQFQSFDNDFDAIVLGWPSIAVREADTVTSLLEQDDFHAMSVVVMSTDQRAETRAWVADRPNSAMLAWKSYESIDETLQSLLSATGGSKESASRPEKLATAKFDNSDIGVLLIDDSPSIRESLSNVLTLHGYRIHAVANRDEAMEAIQDQAIDIAIVDFYLQDETGDEVCREIIKEKPSIICAILTSAYSDPIIKLSLRAGAVDCFFKNEAGELLLARIDALGRVVRQQNALNTERQRLDRLVDSLAGATLLVDESDQLTYVSEQAAAKLGFSDRRELISRSVSIVLDPDKLRSLSFGRHSLQWVNAEQNPIDVDYQMISIPGTSERMLNFKLASDAETLLGDTTLHQSEHRSSIAGVTPAAPVSTPVPSTKLPAANAEVAVTPAVASASVAGSTPSIDGTADKFLHQLVAYQNTSDAPSEPVSLLILGVMFRHNDGRLMPVSDNDELSAMIRESLQAIYRRENHVAQLSGHRYGFLLRHTDPPQSYLLTRKIMQLCNETTLPEALKEQGELCVNGCLSRLTEHDGVAAHDILSRVLDGLRAVDVRGVNQALLLDLRRMLPVYPDNE